MIVTDAFLASLLAMLPTERYTVLYTTTPRTASSADSASSKYSSTKETQQTKSISESYHLEDDLFQSPVHMELKRDFSPRADEEDGDDVDLPDGPLFERYTFLSPGSHHPSSSNQPLQTAPPSKPNLNPLKVIIRK